MLKICVFWGWSIESPKSGAYDRVYHLLYNLVELGCEIELYIIGPSNERYDLDGIKVNVVEYPRFMKNRFCKSLISKIKATYGLYYLASLNPSMARSAMKAIKSSDIILLKDPFQVFPLLFARRENKPVVIDIHAFYLSYLSKFSFKYIVKNFISIFKLMPVMFMEIISLYLCSKIITVSEEEKNAILRLLKIPVSKISVVPNGVEVSNFKLNQSQRQLIRSKHNIRDDDIVILFVGDLNSPHNFYAVEYTVNHIAPKMYKKYKDKVRFLIVGPHDKLPNGFLKSKQIIFTGFVNDLPAYINASDICIAPLSFGAGTKLKMLAYMAASKPIITTELGAEGLNLENGREVIICNTKSIVEELINVIENPKKSADLGKNAFKKSLEYDWKKLALKMEKILISIMEN